ncbi:hypothetical protein [Cytobacillus praedii]|nr:hypothetical protein [Cytobacillus praedii]
MKEKEWTAEDLLPYVEEKEFFTSKYAAFIDDSLRVKMYVGNEVD